MKKLISTIMVIIVLCIMLSLDVNATETANNTPTEPTETTTEPTTEAVTEVITETATDITTEAALETASKNTATSNSKKKTVKKVMSYKNGKKGLKKLKKKLQKQIKAYRGTQSIYVKNLKTNEWMVINNKNIRPASTIKLYNMATIYDQISKGKLKEDSYVKSQLKSMITVSSNDAYNNLLIKMGKGNPAKGIRLINKFCKKHGYKSTEAGGTLSPSSTRNRCWLLRSHTTVKDLGHILEDIYRGQLVSKKASKKMLKYLKAQERRGKIPAGLPRGVKSANKTGEYGPYQHDAAIVFSKKADYIIVVMTDSDGAAISHIQSISRTVYKYFN